MRLPMRSPMRSRLPRQPAAALGTQSSRQTLVGAAKRIFAEWFFRGAAGGVASARTTPAAPAIRRRYNNTLLGFAACPPLCRFL